ncbi:cytochrome b [Marinomonas rhizomae]|uniref:Cytochrome b561 n=1 Tax=Marinomonas rhizomae TaxID=491948 RepID=A0A366JAB5_9GAMM|nr:cytochrome b/b6 domain-containing protein [Marinomonas rhizomae]RBP83893.1 cytochrome b561 [Marinomonas rhizomae]RNF73402.1 cytochrome b [Marinomonas rhizomae]
MTLHIESTGIINQSDTKWRDSQNYYGRVSRTLHWLTAALVILQFFVVLAWRETGKNAVTLFLDSIGPHGSLGLLILVVTLVRLYWTRQNRKQRPPKAPGLGGSVASLVHATFYMLLLFLPAFALLRQYGEGYEIRLYGMTILPEAERHIAWMVAPADLLHSPLSWLLAGLMIGHITMALIHRFWFKDNILARMAG